MKVTTSTFQRPTTSGRALIVLSLSIALLFSILLGSAGAIDRAGVLKRANHWVKKRVPYSQRGYYRGYRRDCSGFVSMAWNLKTSYSTRTIGSRAKRIAITSLKPGDAVLVRGRHVSIFGGWANKKRRSFIALEQTTWGSTARKRVRTIPRRAVAIRRKGIVERHKRTYVASRPIVKVQPKPALVTVPTPTATASSGSQETPTPTAMVAAASLRAAAVTSRVFGQPVQASVATDSREAAALRALL